MLLSDYRDYCLSLPGTTESFPFDQETIVFKVGGKMFTLGNIMDFKSINVKCQPEFAVEQREQYASILPGWHMNKKHWNTIQFIGELTDEQVKGYIYDSYQLVYASLPKTAKQAIKELSKN